MGDDFAGREREFEMLAPFLVRIRTNKKTVAATTFQVDELYTTTPLYALLETRLCLLCVEQARVYSVPTKRTSWGEKRESAMLEWFLTPGRTITFRSMLETFPACINNLLNIVDRYRDVRYLEQGAPRYEKQKPLLEARQKVMQAVREMIRCDHEMAAV